jgi:sugar lactone lactonase YvrE
MKKSHPRSSSSAAILVAASLCFLLSVCGGLAAASSGEGNPFSADAPLLPASDSALAGNRIPAGPVTDPAAAEELPHSELGRAEAEDLLTSVFPTALEEPAGIFNGLEVEEFHSDHVAVVAPADSSGSSGLLSSLLPLRTEDAAGQKAPVDLELEVAGGELEPSNPLVEVGIPTELAEGIALPESNIAIELSGGQAERRASTIGNEAAFYPNVAPDTDLSVVPTPTGVETFTMLRSAQAPQTQTFHLGLPDGSELNANPEGGATVTQAGEPLLTVQPPSAIDAEGNSVPVSLAVAGDSLTLRVDPSSEAAFPILLDPVYESYAWMNSGSNTGIYSDWRAASSNEAILKPSWIGVWSETMHAGLNLRSYPGAIAPGSQANWNYYVPRFFSDYENPAVHERPTSFIRNINLSQIYFLIEEGSPHPNPYMLVGLWDENKGAFASVKTHNSAEGPLQNGTATLPNPYEYPDVKNGGIALATPESTSYPRQLLVGSASVEITDTDFPKFLSSGGPTGWMNETATTPISYAVEDQGLGIASFQVTQPKASGGSNQITTSNQCLGTASNPCPRTTQSAGRTIAYEPKSMPQGENWLQVTATDPVGHQSGVAEVRAKVDHTAPSLALSGNLTEQASVGSKLPSYALNYVAADGDEAAAAATTPIGTTGTGTGQMQRPMGVAVDSGGNVWMVDRENNRVEEFNAKGEFIRQFGTLGSGNGQLSDPRGIAISAAGNVWISELGNKRLQEFNAKGEFIRTITYGGAGGFVEPLAIATGPEETLWVTDIGAHKVFQFKENGTFVRSIASVNLNPGSLSLTTPTGIAVDRYGDAYIAEQASNQVVELSPTGGFVQKFGSTGTGEGQFKAPNGIAIAASGNVFVVDAENSRVEEFKPDGTFLRQFASPGTATNQLAEPRGIAVAPGNEVLIADAANHRLARWTHADKDPQSGAAKVEVKVDGSAAKSEAPGCSTKNCQISGSWTLNADNYPAGAHKVEVIATDGVGLTTTKTLNIETHGDYAAPQIALSGTMTEQATLGATRPTYKLRAAATDPGSAEERKSGVASETIKFDGTVVDSSAPGCPAEGCSLTREWTLESSSKAAGSHKVEVIATDVAGHTTTKTLEIKIERDTTAPVLETGSEKFFTAPGGWLEQKSYSYIAAATDQNGYGVTSLQLKIDGAVVKSTSGTCSAGGCEKFFFSSINMASYAGGAHKAELVAIDGAGNYRTKTWTMNIDPSGHISTQEATATVEAAEATGSTNLVGNSEREEGVEGTAPGLGLEKTAEGYLATGSAAPTAIPPNAGESLMVKIPSASELYSCHDSTLETSSDESEQQLEEHIRLDPEEEAPCEGTESESELIPVEITPLNVGEGAAAPKLVEENAVLSANTGTASDTAIRPLDDGGMIFQSIRDNTAPESYSYRVTLYEDQKLRQIDDSSVEVEYSEGHPAFAITVEPAHDAVGTTVPTTLQLAGNDVVTLTVHYKAGHEGQPFIFPVVGGTGWEGGFQTVEATIENGVEEGQEEIGGSEVIGNEVLAVTAHSQGPPVATGSVAEFQEIKTYTHKFKFDECRYPIPPAETNGGTVPPEQRDVRLAEHITHCLKELSGFDLISAMSVHGHFEIAPNVYVKMPDPVSCDKWGPQQPAKVHCEKSRSGRSETIGVWGNYRFPPLKGNYFSGPTSACVTVIGTINAEPTHLEQGETVLSPAKAYLPEHPDTGEPCHWPSWSGQ